MPTRYNSEVFHFDKMALATFTFIDFVGQTISSKFGLTSFPIKKEKLVTLILSPQSNYETVPFFISK